MVGDGVILIGADGTIVQGNWIGVARDGKSSLGPGSQGIELFNAHDNVIGGDTTGAGNVIAFSEGPGILINSPFDSNPSGNRISGNSIYANAGLGIAGVGGENDRGDGDFGRNGGQNYPVLTSAKPISGDTVRLTGVLNSKPQKTYRLEFFGNEVADPSGYGEGEFYLGFTNVTTDSVGYASFDLTLPRPPSAAVFSATATDADGNTSQFSSTVLGQLQNISTRARVQTGDNIAIAGFIVTGTDSKRVILRGIGPSLEISGVPFEGRLEDPVLQLFGQDNLLLATNDDWQDSQKSEIEQIGVAPSNEHESAIVRTLAPGAYTVALSGKNHTTGVGLVEGYDLSPASASQLANISTRSFVETGENVMIGGFIIGPAGGARLLVRAIGPSLGDAGVQHVMQDPMLEVRDADGALVAANDDWTTNQAQVTETGAPPKDVRESALVADLPPGSYTAIVSGKDNSVGVALVEIYDLR